MTPGFIRVLSKPPQKKRGDPNGFRHERLTSVRLDSRSTVYTLLEDLAQHVLCEMEKTAEKLFSDYLFIYLFITLHVQLGSGLPKMKSL